MLGIDPIILVRNGTAAVAAICADPGAGTALGRITYKFSADGSRVRRVGDFGSGIEEWITADMEAAAEAYRTLWVRWYRAVGLPRRHPQGMTFERIPKGEGPDRDIDHGALMDRMHAVETAILNCPQNRLVVAVIDSVLIDNIAPDGLVLGERADALAALRRGLDAIGRVLLGKRKRAA